MTNFKNVSTPLLLALLIFSLACARSEQLRGQANAPVKNVDGIPVAFPPKPWYQKQKNPDKQSPSERSPSAIVQKTREYIGYPYYFGGDQPEQGFDCSGLVKYVFASFGRELPHSASLQFKISKRIPPREAQPGDLVFFDITGKGISHVGIYIGQMKFIHAPKPKQKVGIASMNIPYWQKRFRGVGRLTIPDAKIIK